MKTITPHQVSPKIQARLDQIIPLLENPITIREIISKTGMNYRSVYRDLIRLINLGYKVENKLTTYWISNPF